MWRRCADAERSAAAARARKASASLGRSRYQRDLLRLIDRFGSVENGFRWLRDRRAEGEFLPEAGHWDDSEVGS
jgi:hypothetical protein